MKLKLDANNRKFIEVEIEGEESTLKYYEKNTKQIKALKKLSRKEDAKVSDVDDLVEKQFLENLQGDKALVKKIIDFYEENGNFYEFINACDKELGKLKKSE